MPATPDRAPCICHRPDDEHAAGAGRPDLIARMREGMSAVATNPSIPLLRYCRSFGGSGMDKEAAAAWLSRRGAGAVAGPLSFVTPGAHPALLCHSSACWQALDQMGAFATHPVPASRSIRRFAIARPGSATGLPMDGRTVLLRVLFADACERALRQALYLNPTLQNPTTITMPQQRREEICAVARRYHVAIIEDDAYGFIPLHGPAPLAAMAPDLAWHIGGLAEMHRGPASIGLRGCARHESGMAPRQRDTGKQCDGVTADGKRLRHAGSRTAPRTQSCASFCAGICCPTGNG